MGVLTAILSIDPQVTALFSVGNSPDLNELGDEWENG